MGVPMMRGLEGDKYDRQYSDRYLFQRLASYFIPYRRQVIVIITAFLALAIVAGLRPVLISIGVAALENPDGSNTLTLLFVALVIAAIVGFPALWFRSRLIFFLVALWVIVTILVFTPTWLRTIHQQYFTSSLPALCLLAGAGVAWLIRLMPGKPYSRMIILAAYGVVFLSQALWWRGVLRYLEITAR